MLSLTFISQMLLAAFDALDAPLGRSKPIVPVPGHAAAWCRSRLLRAHTVGQLIDASLLNTIITWVITAHQYLEAQFLEEEGDDAEGCEIAHWLAVDQLTTLLSNAWWDTTEASPVVVALALGERTTGRSFPVARASWVMREWLYAAYDAHQLLAQQGGLLCCQAGAPTYQPPEEERLNWD